LVLGPLTLNLIEFLVNLLDAKEIVSSLSIVQSVDDIIRRRTNDVFRWHGTTFEYYGDESGYQHAAHSLLMPQIDKMNLPLPTEDSK